jgi:CheY-like chemotaxis protein
MPPNPMTDTETKRILLVDDDPAGAELTLAALSEFQLQDDVDVTADGEDALDYLFCRGEYAARPNQLPAVILLDLKMPKIDGHEVLRQIRANDKLRNIPVIVLTSSDQEADISLSYQLGTNGYMTKPVNILDFIEDLRGMNSFWEFLNRKPPP